MRTAIPFVTASVLLAAQAASAQVVFLDTFGNTATRQTSPYVPQFIGAASGFTGHYVFADPHSTQNTVAGSITVSPNDKRLLLDATYAVVNPQNIRDIITLSPSGTAQAGSWWAVGAPAGDYTLYRDHTGDSGAVLVVNAGKVKNDIYRRVVNLQPGKTYKASAWLLLDQGPVQVGFSLRDGTDQNLAAAGPVFCKAGGSAANNCPTPHTAITGGNAPNQVWQPMAWTFSVGNACAMPTQYSLALSSLITETTGNDYFIDDVQLEEVPADASATVIACPQTDAPPPTATPDTGFTNQDTPTSINLTGNDSPPAGETLSPPTLATPPKNGTVTIDPSTGTATYTPAPGFTGIDTFSYEVCTVPSTTSPNAICTTATVTVNVLGATAQPDSAVSASGDPVKIDIVANDSSSDPSNAPLNPLATPVTPPSNGTVVYNADGTATYTPNPGYVGADSFQYQICTVQGPYAQPACATTTVTINSAQPVPVNNIWALLALALAMGGWTWARRRA